MLISIRKKVSQKRNRHVDEEFNLDLTYITSRIIAMSYPSEGFESLYRNAYPDVKKFLTFRHTGHYKVYNLRNEKLYDSSKFEKVANYPFLDHQAPPFSYLIDFCEDAAEFLSKDPNNVIVVHCKAGKGRTGTMIACVLLHLGEAKDAAEAIEIYGKKRSSDEKGITIPSQVRYVHYYDYMLKHSITYKELENTRIALSQITIHNLPHSLRTSMSFELRVLEKLETCIYRKQSNELDKTQDVNNLLLKTNDIPELKEDFKVEIHVKGKILCSFWLNSVFISISDLSSIKLKKQDIDLAFSDKACKEFSESFAINLMFIQSRIND